MRISCPQCSSQYNVDEKRIPPQGVQIKCPKCLHAFVVQAPAADAGAVPLPGGGGAVPLPGGGGAVPLPGGAGAVPLPGGGGAVPLPGGAGAV
ncbi:MAG: zinc-ribbon domain-containing protein, partial [Deltaproteobacteria bacterium]|nr:zinc-ribbon domain-containing protein [Deltaproteobacteria bacterium]